MALSFSIDLSGATFEELSTFVEALHTAGMKSNAVLKLDGSKLVATVEPGSTVSEPERSSASRVSYPDVFPGSGGSMDFMKFGDAALDSLIEALKYRRGR